MAVLTVLIALTQGISYDSMSEGEKFIYIQLSKKITAIDTQISGLGTVVARLETHADRTKEDVDRIREWNRSQESELKLLNRFKDESTGRRAVEVSIAALLAGMVMSFVNRRWAILSKKRGRG